MHRVEPADRRVEAACRLVTWAVLALAPVLLALAALANTLRLNPDAVAYLQVALHWRHGALDLAISTYWGPLFSWMAAAVLLALPDPLAAGRIVMALSAMLFLAGGIALLRSLQVPAPARAVGAICLLAFALGWSVQIMTPDLLVSGLMAAALAVALRPGWRDGLGAQAAAGALFGLGYLAKAVALPLALPLIGAAALWHLCEAGTGAWRGVLRAALRTAAVAALVAAPWILVVSAKQGKPGMGTAGSVNLAVAGPSYHAAAGNRFDPYHPAFTTFHAPHPGRVTAWEEAVELPYRHWSPLADAASALHMARLVRHNAESTLASLQGFDLLGLGLAAALLAPFLAIGPPRPWRFVLVPLLPVVAVYLPVLSNGETRYFMLCYPLLLAAAGGMLFAARPAAPRLRALHGLAAVLLLAVSFLPPLRHDVAVALAGRPNPAFVAAQHVAAAAREAGVAGGVASVGELGFAGIFTAFLLGQPFMGTEDALPEAGRLQALGAGLLLVARDGPAEAALATDPRAERLPLPDTMLSAWRLR